MSTSLTCLELAIEQIEFARRYTLGLLADVPDELWFQMPGDCVTHVAWQAGHLAMAEYGLCLFRIRGRQPEDAELMSGSFRKKFSRGSTPQADPAANPTAAEIREVLTRVHQRVLLELPGTANAELDEPIDEPYSVSPTKLGGLYFCAAHEMLHAGQIGLLRRLLGKAPCR